MKKITGVFLMIAILMSALNMSVYAIVPGEDSYMGQEDGYIQIDYETQTQRFIPKSEIPEFSGDSSYDALNPAERARMDTINSQIAAYHNQEASSFNVNNGEYSFVGSNLINYMQYTGVVLIAAFDNGVYKKHGTGFMINSQNIMTALHVVSETNPYTDEFIMPLHIYDEIRVYFGITELLEERDYNTFFDSDHTDYVEVSIGTLSTGINSYPNMMKYDWYIGTLETPVNNAYIFNCYTATPTIENIESYIVGYPGQYEYEMVVTYGQTTIFVTGSWAIAVPEGEDMITSSNVGEDGISGGPLYIFSGGTPRCYGVFTSTTGAAGDASSWSVSFYDDLMDVIVEIISN